MDNFLIYMDFYVNLSKFMILSYNSGERDKTSSFPHDHIFFPQLVLQFPEQHVVEVYPKLGGGHEQFPGIFTEKIHRGIPLKNTE